MVLPRVEAPAKEGLTAAQARERLENGYGNTQTKSATKTVGQIIISNVCTYFNLIFCILAVFIALVGSYNDLMFMPIIIINAIIGIVQELRSKRVTDRLTLVSAPKATLVRDSQIITVPTWEAVRDDIALFSPGNQIYADAVIIDGTCQVNESLVTGEADEISKVPGDTLLSGSYIVSGECVTRLEKVGADSFVSKLTAEAKKRGGMKRSEMLSSLNKLLKVIGVLIIPLGIFMFLQQTRILGNTVRGGVVSTVGALIGMIPEGLFLLVSVALVVSIMRLAGQKTLVHEMGCIETLARVDVLCVDKTGTITENKMSVDGVTTISDISEDEAVSLLSRYTAAFGTENATMQALKEYFPGGTNVGIESVLQFSSETKYSGIRLTNGKSYILGAPEMIMRSNYGVIQDAIEPYSSQGVRVLLLAETDGDMTARPITGRIKPLAIVRLSNKIRSDAIRTFEFFRKQGVKILVISGDNPVTVSSVAQQAGIENADRYIDASTLTTERKIKRAVSEYTVFGRVTPENKRSLVRALKQAGHTVAMTGDGVNDILAMKDADCSIAMASGSEVASQVAQIVLMDSNFSAMPSVVVEGRRVINNIERSASLFLVKNIFSFILSIFTLIFAMTYPLAPSQLSLVNMATIGIPSFVLALEFNKDRVEGKFLKNVLLRAMPAGLTDFLLILALLFIGRKLAIPQEQMSSMAMFVVAFVGFTMVYQTCKPFTAIRTALFIAVIVFFVGGVLIVPNLFSITKLEGKYWLIEAGAMVVSLPIHFGLWQIAYFLGAKRPKEKFSIFTKTTKHS